MIHLLASISNLELCLERMGVPIEVWFLGCPYIHDMLVQLLLLEPGVKHLEKVPNKSTQQWSCKSFNSRTCKIYSSNASVSTSSWPSPSVPSICSDSASQNADLVVHRSWLFIPKNVQGVWKKGPSEKLHGIESKCTALMTKLEWEKTIELTSEIIRMTSHALTWFFTMPGLRNLLPQMLDCDLQILRSVSSSCSVGSASGRWNSGRSLTWMPKTTTMPTKSHKS